MTARALQGCRVLDLGILTAGAAASALLADLGADVIKVESRRYPDPFRVWPAGTMNEQLRRHHCPPFFRATNRNKRSLSLDLKCPEGRSAFLRLARRSDVVVENFRRGVLEGLGLGYDALCAVNDGIVLASLSSQGETGPEADRVSFGSTLEATGGLAWLTGYAGAEPVISGQILNYADQVVAIFGAGMIVTALHRRAATGRGAHLELSQRELMSYLVGEAFVAPDEAAQGRQGNAQPPHVVQQCYRSADGVWLAVTLDRQQVAAVDAIIGNGPVPASQPDPDTLDSRLGKWIGARSAASCIERLREARIPVARVLDGVQALAEHRRSGDALVELADGTLVKGFPFQLERMKLRVDDDAHAPGADSAAILTEVAGYTPAEVAALIERHVVDAPAP